MIYRKVVTFMRKSRKIVISVLAVSLLGSMVAMPAAAADIAEMNGGSLLTEVSSGYSFSLADGTFDFCDHIHKITIDGSKIANAIDLRFDGRDISYYGLNDDGALAIVYFNTEADEGRGLIAGTDSMTYITYQNGSMTEVTREIGTAGLFGFDMANADSSLEGMMNVFNGSLFSFVGAFGTVSADYSAVCGGSAASGKAAYVKSERQKFMLVDDNYITNEAGSRNEAFFANEMGIYSGYEVVDGVDYNVFCFFGSNDDVYYFAYGLTDDGYRVMTMKGTAEQQNERVKKVRLENVDITKASDSASQYMMKMAACLAAAQGGASMGLDTMQIQQTVLWKRFCLVPALEVKTAFASGTLTLDCAKGVYSGSISDENGNAQSLSIALQGKNYVITAESVGTYTIANQCGYGSLKAANPSKAKHTSPCCKSSEWWLHSWNAGSNWFGNWNYHNCPCNWFWGWFWF